MDRSDVTPWTRASPMALPPRSKTWTSSVRVRAVAELEASLDSGSELLGGSSGASSAVLRSGDSVIVSAGCIPGVRASSVELPANRSRPKAMIAARMSSPHAFLGSSSR